MIFNGLTREQNMLLSLVAKNFNSQSFVMPKNNLQNLDWEEIAKESVYQSVSLLAFESASDYKNDIPREIYEKWKNVVIKTIRLNQTVNNAEKELAELMDKNSYPFIILKGSASAFYYDNSELRTFGDVDFLIEKKDKDCLEKLFTENGYVMSQGDHPNHVVFKKPGANLEMHFEVAGIPYGEKGEKIRKFLEGAIISRQIQKVNEINLPFPSPVNHAIILLLHSQHHLLGEGLGLRHLLDLAYFVDKTKDEDFWINELIPFLKEIGLLVFTKALVCTACKAFDLVIPKWAKDVDEKLTEEVLEDVFRGGNFGRKDKNRSSSGMLISEHGKGGTKHGAIYNLAHSLHLAVIRQYPIVKKVWIFYPFIYIYKALRFLFLSLIGKRPSLVKMAPEAKKRKKIYDKLHVFQTEEK